MHVHVQSSDGEAKYWIEPEIELAVNYRLGARELRIVEELIREHEDAIRTAWTEHFSS